MGDGALYRHTHLDAMKRSLLNPILSAKDVPYEASLVFNAGVCKWQGEYVMLFRNDHGPTEESFRAARAAGAWQSFSTNLGIARSPDGMILEDSGEVKIYYGAADTVECLATADVGELIEMCEPM